MTKDYFFIWKFYLVVEVVDVNPLNPFSFIVLLLLLQNQLDEELLKQFIAIVNAKLKFKNYVFFDVFLEK